MPPMPSRRWLYPLILALVVALALWPWLGRLHAVPLTMDGTLWVGRSALSTEGWWRWDLLGPHFIGYRPLPALSFTLASAVSGLDPWAHRLVDLLLHGGLLVAVWATYRALAPHRPAWGGLVAVAVVALHPGVEEAVPILARRSYLVATLLGTLAVWARAGPRKPWLSAGLLLGALLSNESAWPLVLLLPLISWQMEPPSSWRARVLAALPAGAALVLAVALRLGLTGKVGGYGSMGLSLGGLASVGSRASAYLLFPPSASDEPALVLGGVVGMAAVGLWLAWVAVVRPLLHRRGARARVPALLGAWALAHVLLYMVTGSWYFREAYPVLVPLGLLVGVGVADLGSRGWPLRVAEGAALVILGVSLASRSPVLWGPDPLRERQSTLYQARVHALLEAMEAQEVQGTVWLVVPVGEAHRERNKGRRQVRYQARRMSTWASLVQDGVEVRDAAYLFDEDSGVRLEERVLVFPRKARTQVPRGMSRLHGELPLSALPETEGEVWVAWFAGSEAHLLPL